VYTLMAQVWLSPSLATKRNGASIERRTKVAGDSSDYDPARVVTRHLTRDPRPTAIAFARGVGRMSGGIWRHRSCNSCMAIAPPAETARSMSGQGGTCVLRIAS
jgi:hypothetical protein